jgi:hypothetical protein
MNTLFQGVQCLGDAKNLMREHEVLFNSTFQFVYPKRNSFHMVMPEDRGIHIYFMDENNNDLGYYTPIMQTLCIFDKPRMVHPQLLKKGEIKHD